ncbi:hypothetical protein HGM15179_020810 [Zosterops borbonicus]|uniref:Uncharacterized protein n=1 Tax=Zosterops borbonicus TaxID=364589 RepID=A0A8K1D723_9PASS|nr:hypothetical protein HGM15179_020810 [Zosterops borbonicus]
MTEQEGGGDLGLILVWLKRRFLDGHKGFSLAVGGRGDVPSIPSPAECLSRKTTGMRSQMAEFPFPFSQSSWIQENPGEQGIQILWDHGMVFTKPTGMRPQNGSPFPFSMLFPQQLDPGIQILWDRGIMSTKPTGMRPQNGRTSFPLFPLSRIQGNPGKWGIQILWDHGMVSNKPQG